MVNNSIPDDRWLEDLAAEVEPVPAGPERTPSRQKSRVYSALVRCQQESGPLLSLTETRAAGSSLCVHEELLRISPAGEKAKRFDCCSVCHARVLAENLDNAPIYWGHCPYVRFQNH